MPLRGVTKPAGHASHPSVKFALGVRYVSFAKRPAAHLTHWCVPVTVILTYSPGPHRSVGTKVGIADGAAVGEGRGSMVGDGTGTRVGNGTG